MSGADFLQALDNDFVVIVQAAFDNLFVTHNITEDNPALFGNAVFVDDHNVVAVFILSDSRLRN